MHKLDERISTLESRLKELKARPRQIETRRRAIGSRRTRKADTRHKVLVGAIVLERVERGALARDELHAWLDAALTRAEDRALFGLPVR